MQYFFATAAVVATAAASSLIQREEFNMNGSYTPGEAYAKVVNRCSYPVYLWSIAKEDACPSGEGVKLETGNFYRENYRTEFAGGISLKLSKSTTCAGQPITQLEYKISAQEGYEGNFLDMSFVDCPSGQEKHCPGRTDGFYLKSGNQDGAYISEVNNEHCPIFSVFNAEEAAAVSYLNPDDRQTKFCNQKANLELYLCGGDAPSVDGSDSYATPASSAAASSSQAKSSSAPEPSSEASSPAPAPSSTSADDEYAVAAAAVTPAAAIEDANVATALVVVTETVWVDAPVKRSRHAHGRRHQHYHA